MPQDPKKKKLFDPEKFMKGIAHVESGGGKYMKNPTSSASGLYQQLYRGIPKTFLQERGIDSRDSFIADTAAQNAFMRQRIHGDMSKLPRRTNLFQDAMDLEAEYSPQLGDDYTYRPDEVAALSHYMGRQGARNYFGGVRDGKPYMPSGVNKEPKEYLKLYNEGLNLKRRGGEIIDKKKLSPPGYSTFKNKFNTSLGPLETINYYNWLHKESKDRGRPIIKDIDTYDLQGFWKGNESVDSRGHGTDKYKKPSHPTFSNESKYHGVDGFVGGSWGPGTYTASPTNKYYNSPDEMLWQMQDDPNVKLIYEQGGPVMAKKTKGGDPKLSKDYWGITTNGGTFNYNDAGIYGLFPVALSKRKDASGRRNLMSPNMLKRHGENKKELALLKKKRGKMMKYNKLNDKGNEILAEYNSIPQMGGEPAQVDAISYAIGGQLPQAPVEAYGNLLQPDKIPLPAQQPIVSEASSGTQDIAMDAAGSLPGVAGIAGKAIGAQFQLFNGLAQTDEKALQERVSKFARPAYLQALNGKDLSDRVEMTEYNGDTHEEGGISLPGLNVEVEDGETRTGDMVHSDNIIVTKELVDAYPKSLKNGDIGKTIAQLSKLKKKKFDKRKNDEWNNTAALAVVEPLENISRDLSMVNSNPNEMGYPKAEGGMDLLGYAPLVANAASTAISAGRLDNLNYPKVGYEKAETSLRSVDPGIKKIRTIFGNAKNRLRKYNAPGALARETELAAAEAGAVTQEAGNVAATNQMAKNRTSMVNAQLGSRAKSQSAAYDVQEQQDDAMNRGARRSAISAGVANFGTIGGQMSRDSKLMAEDVRKNKAMEEIYKGYADFYKEAPQEMANPVGSMLADYPDTMPDTKAEEDMFAGTIPLMKPTSYKLRKGGSLAHKLRLSSYKKF